ncbi:MAG: GH92 family glycosyl hydrolase, partial [Candidatus Cryptobacteroides sp.]
FFHAEFSQPFTKGSEFNMAEDENATSLIFNTSEQKTIYAKVGISSVSTANAKANLEAEIRGWDFDRTAEAARAKWNKSLGCIEIEGISTEQETIFYTSLYHTMVAPSLFSDTDLSYRGADGNVHKGSGNTYTTFSLWDTYRTASPLMTIINPQMCKEIGSTMVNIWKEQGKLPVWHLHGNETDCMVGNPGVIVLGDLVMKGLYENVPEALQAMKESSLLDERGMELLKVYGYIPFDKSAEVETVAKGLEFAIADAAVAKVAEKAGDNEATAYFGERMLSYKNYFDPETGFMRGRAADGSFRTPFDPFLALHMRSDYTEGNAWQYTWLVPQDVDGLIGLFGGKEAFLNKLSEFFTAEGDLGPDANDVTGLIGQYAHGNEPSHHVAYLFSHIGEYDLCAEYVRKILRELYRNDSDGICGNEDVGQMSAWYVMSSLGFYQIDPCGGDFIIGSPAVKKAVIHLPEGKTFTISAPGNSEEKVYVKSVKLNGVTLKDRRFSYEDLMKGGVLEFEM